MVRDFEPEGDFMRRRAQFVRDGIPPELYRDRIDWARRARSAALFDALAALLAWPRKRIEALWASRLREREAKR